MLETTRALSSILGALTTKDEYLRGAYQQNCATIQILFTLGQMFSAESISRRVGLYFIDIPFDVLLAIKLFNGRVRAVIECEETDNV